MAIRTTIARHYAVRLIVMTIVMFVLGVWGVYDYVVAIPAHQKAFDRYQAMQLTQRALQPDLKGEALTQTVNEASAAIEREIAALLDTHAARAGVDRLAVKGPTWNAMLLALSEQSSQVGDDIAGRPEYQQSLQIVESLRATNELDWMKALLTFEQALSQPRDFDGNLNPSQRAVYQLTEQQMNQVSKDEAPTPPSTFDHVVQLLYISLLLCVPYFLWVYVSTTRRVYELDDDGTLRTPEGTWSADEIADIDMSRWMAKSTAQVVHTDGRRITLDDYKHRNMHLIVGALAHRFDPEKWTTEAKLVKKDAEEDAEAEAIHDEQEAVNDALDGESRV